MSDERPRFFVSAETTMGVFEDADSYDETLDYAKRVLGVAREKQKVLCRYFREIAVQLGDYYSSYSIGIAMGYDVATRVLEGNGVHVEIDDSDIDTHRRSAGSVFDDPRLEDEEWVMQMMESTDTANGSGSGLGLFLNTLDACAPEFALQVCGLVRFSIEEHVNRKNALRGFYDGFMPFYRKALALAEGEN